MININDNFVKASQLKRIMKRKVLKNGLNNIAKVDLRNIVTWQILKFY